MKRQLHELTKEEYSTLKEMGFLYEFYPEATGDYLADTGETVYLNVYKCSNGAHKIGGVYKSKVERNFYGLQSKQEPDPSEWVGNISIHIGSDGIPTFQWERKA